MFVSLPLSCLLISTITKQSSSIWKHVNCLCSSLRLSTQSFSRPLTSYFIAHRPWHSICRVQVQVQENFYSRCFMWAIIEWNVTAVKHPSVKNVLRTLTCVDKWSANVINSKSIDPGDCFETAICKPLSGKSSPETTCDKMKYKCTARISLVTLSKKQETWSWSFSNENTFSCHEVYVRLY